MLLFFSFLIFVATLFAREIFYPVIKRLHIRESSIRLSLLVLLKPQRRLFVTATLFQPLLILFTESIMTTIYFYVVCEFATLFLFFTAFLFVFEGIYKFLLEQLGLVFLSIVVGYLLRAITVLLYNVLLYCRKAANFLVGKQVPPELYLYPALIGSASLLLGLFWFSWVLYIYTF